MAKQKPDNRILDYFQSSKIPTWFVAQACGIKHTEILDTLAKYGISTFPVRNIDYDGAFINVSNSDASIHHLAPCNMVVCAIKRCYGKRAVNRLAASLRGVRIPAPKESDVSDDDIEPLALALACIVDHYRLGIINRHKALCQLDQIINAHLIISVEKSLELKRMLLDNQQRQKPVCRDAA